MSLKKTTENHLFVFGPGYSAKPFMAKAKTNGWCVSATYRKKEDKEALAAAGYTPVRFADFDEDGLAQSLFEIPVSHILTSVAPDRTNGNDPVLSAAEPWLKQQANLGWIGYLSSTNVYGDHLGAWVDEKTPPQPSLERGKRRLLAENNWLALANVLNARTHVFRLAGIYGPGKNALQTVRSGKAKRIFKEGQVFGRVHREDICEALWLAATSDAASGVFNLSDDMPAPPQDVIEEAASLLGVPVPALTPFEDADLSPMGRSFYTDNKRVRNDRAKEVLGWAPKYPDYKTALAKMLKSGM